MRLNLNKTEKNKNHLSFFKLTAWLGIALLLENKLAAAEKFSSQNKHCVSSGFDFESCWEGGGWEDDTTFIDRIVCMVTHFYIISDVREKIEKTIQKYDLDSVNGQCYSACEGMYTNTNTSGELELLSDCELACDVAEQESVVTPLSHNDFALLSECSCDDLAEKFSDANNQKAVRYGYQAYACLFNYSYYYGLNIEPPAELAPATNCSYPMPEICLYGPPAPTPGPTGEPTSVPSTSSPTSYFPTLAPITDEPTFDPTSSMPTGEPTVLYDPSSESSAGAHSKKFDAFAFAIAFPIVSLFCFLCCCLEPLKNSIKSTLVERYLADERLKANNRIKTPGVLGACASWFCCVKAEKILLVGVRDNLIEHDSRQEAVDGDVLVGGSDGDRENAKFSAV